MLGRVESYERTYSQLLDAELQQQANDYCIARALAEEGPAPTPAAARPPDTSLDGALALQLHETEVERLTRPPGKRHRKRKGLYKLLQHLRFTKVVPRLNPSVHPSDNFISQDRERLLLRLDMYALKERQVVGDGNCQFRAIADQLWYDEGRHMEVRQAVVEQLCQHPERYRDYVTTDYQQYISSMSSPGTWGDHVTLQAAADAFQVRTCIVSSFLENCVISIYPTDHDIPKKELPEVEQLEDVQQQLSPRRSLRDKTVWLAFWAEVHYNSLAAKAQESPSEWESSDDDSSTSSASSSEAGSTPRKEKLLGSTRLKHAADVLVPSKLRP